MTVYCSYSKISLRSGFAFAPREAREEDCSKSAQLHLTLSDLCNFHVAPHKIYLTPCSPIRSMQLYLPPSDLSDILSIDIFEFSIGTFRFIELSWYPPLIFFKMMYNLFHLKYIWRVFAHLLHTSLRSGFAFAPREAREEDYSKSAQLHVAPSDLLNFIRSM